MATLSQELEEAAGARHAIFPEDGSPLSSSSQDPNSQSHLLYVKSHGAYAAGEQRRRDYDWASTHIDPSTHAFGKNILFSGSSAVVDL